MSYTLTFLEIDVIAANSLLADHEIALLTSPPPHSSSAPAAQHPYSEPRLMGPPTPVVTPPTPDAGATFSERERAFSAPQVLSHSENAPTLSTSPPPTTPAEEIDDPLSYHWRQSPKRSSSLLRRLSRGSHRKTGSLPGDLHRSPSEPPPELRREDDDDIVHIPEQLQRGMEMLRVTRKKVTKRICSIDPVNGCVAWDSKDSSKSISPHEIY